MTLECCNRMAKEVLSSESMLDEAVEEYKTKYKDPEDAFGKIPDVPNGTNGRRATARYPKTIFNLRDDGSVDFNAPKSGFHAQYSIPRSKTTDLSDIWLREYGYTETEIEEARARNVLDLQKIYPGLYPTRMDMNFLFGVGQDYGKQKILGMQSRCSYYRTLLNYDTHKYEVKKLYGSPFGYSVNESIPPGAVMRDADGPRMIKTTAGSWKEYKPSKFVKSDYQMDYFPTTGANNEADTTIRKNLASIYYGKENGIYLIGELIGTGETVIFTNKLLYFTPQLGWHSLNWDNLCYGNSVLKLSKYNDLETNPNHANDYIEVLRSTSRGMEPVSKEKAIPLKYKVSYYLYLDLDNRPKPSLVSASYKTRQEAVILVYRTYRQLLWPDTKPS